MTKMSKPLQGYTCTKFKRVIMGKDSVKDLHRRSVLEKSNSPLRTKDGRNSSGPPESDCDEWTVVKRRRKKPK